MRNKKRKKQRKNNFNEYEYEYEELWEDYFICKNCGRKISEYDFYNHDGLCKYCRGIIIQKGFPAPPGFPKI